VSVFSQVASFWAEGALDAIDSFRRGYGCAENDPPPATPSDIVYEGGKVRLRHYHARGPVRHRTPLLLIYALIKRPFILDLMPGKSVVEKLTKAGFDVYLTDWIPPNDDDTWRDFNAYVNGDVANSVRAIQIEHDTDQVNILGYCFGALLALSYTAFNPDIVKNLIVLTTPFDMSKRELPISHLMEHLSPHTAELVTSIHGNAPAWAINLMFNAMSPPHHLLNKFVGRYRNLDREGYDEMFTLFERWMASDVPLAGGVFKEMASELAGENKLCRNLFEIGGRRVDLTSITMPLLNIIGEYDDVVHPSQSYGVLDAVGSTDKRTIAFPAGHIGVGVGDSALKKLWPEVTKWLAEHD